MLCIYDFESYFYGMKINFCLSSSNPVTHFLEIEMTIEGIDSGELILELPCWRPGRYELGNFAKNIRKWQAFDEKNEILAFKKTSKDTWKVSTEGSQKIIVRYEYYCAQPDAGACWVDENQIYVNPIHCFLYVADKLHEPCTVELNVPTNFKIACSMKKTGEHVLTSGDFHELYDSPFIASASLQMQKYNAGGKEFFIWFQGHCVPDWGRIIHDFHAFSEDQFKMMGDFPFDTYHFLVLILPYRFYHGVEHINSTVLALGPGTQLMNDPLYIDFTGVASHELFHAWNVKSVRPADMLPYDYKKENYSRLGYVYEGVTTYYGDLFLARCGVYSVQQFFNEIDVRLQKHFDNAGRFNLSVADSSFDTWLDGYNPGIPGRKSSIYDEGCITALMTDLLIRKATNSANSLDDVMKTLYNDFGKKKLGYTDHDYISLVEFVSGRSMSDFFLDHVYGVENDETLLEDLLSHAGCELVKKPSADHAERNFGFKTVIQDKATVVTSIWKDSPAFEAGLGKDDEIIAVNEIRIEGNLQEILGNLQNEKVIFTVVTPMKLLKDLAITSSSNQFYNKYFLRKKKSVTNEATAFFKSWIGYEFEESVKHEV